MNNSWIVFRGKDGKYAAAEDVHEGLLQKMINNGVEVFGCVSMDRAIDSIEYVKALLGEIEDGA